MINLNNPFYLLNANILVTFISSVLIWLLLGALFIYWHNSKKFNKKMMFFILLSGVMAYITSTVFKNLIGTTRPYLINGSRPLTLTIPQDASFPSSHVAFAFALAIAVYLKDKKAGLVMVFIALLVGLGRILSNVHYPVDVLGGVVWGSFIALLVDYLFSKRHR